MGVIHKLKPEVLNFIIENKQNNPALSCRDLTSLILEKFQVKVSKSSINAVFKKNNLSMPIGRRQKEREKKFNLPVLPVIAEVKAIMLVAEPANPLQERKVDASLPGAVGEEEKGIKEAEERAIELNEDAKKITEEKAAQEPGLSIEKEKWARLAEEGLKAMQQGSFAASALPQNRVCSGAILLKALDCLIGGSKEINEAICKEMGGQPEDFLHLTEALIFRPLSGKDNLSALGDLIGIRYSQEKLDNYYAQVQQIKTIKIDTTKIISSVFTEAKGVKVHFIDGSIVRLDGQLHSSWSTPYIPYDFSSTVYDLKNKLNKYFFQGQPLVLFSAPGYDILSKDFFNLLLNIGSKDNYPDTLTLFGNKLEKLDTISLNHENKYCLVFGFWPWQFTGSRKVKKIGDFDLRHIEEIDKDLYLGEIEIDLLQTSSNQSITLKGCAVKTDLKEKIRLVILNSDEQPISLDKLAGIYLSRWPSFEEAFQDFSRKIELFTYAGTAQKFFSKESLGIDMLGPTLELEEIFANYIKMLDAYLRWHFLPAGYTEKDFPTINERFYSLKAKLKQEKTYILVSFQPLSGYTFLKDLEYACRRINEREVVSSDGKRLWFSVQENAFL